MKSKFLFIPVMLVLSFGIGSCATAKSRSAKMSGTERAAAASSTMELVENDIRLLVMQISTTNSALQTLVQTEQVDIEKAYKEYVATFNATKDTAERFFAHSDKQNQQIRDYFDEWQTQANAYANPEVQALSEQRRVELSAVNASIAEANVGVMGTLNQYITTTNEIKTYFSTDLTTKGVEAIVPVAQSAIVNGIFLRSSLESLYTSIATLRAELSTSTIQ